MYNRALLILKCQRFFMPIYEYLCQKCDHQFDALQKMADNPLTDCPECKESELIKLVSAPSFRLSGTGWYETDFKKDNDKKKNLTEGSNKTDSKTESNSEGKKPEGKSDSKAETKKDSKTDKPKVASKEGNKASSVSSTKTSA